MQRTSAHYPHSAVCTILATDGQRKTVIYSLDPFTGKTIEVQHHATGVLQSMLVSSVHDSEYRRAILYLDSQRKAHLYPDTTRELFAKVANYYFMMLANETSGQFVGMSFANSTAAGPQATEVWSFGLPQESIKSFSKLAAVFKRPNEHVHSQGRVLGDRNVLYKYVNPNLVAVCWESLDLADKRKFRLSIDIKSVLIVLFTSASLFVPCGLDHRHHSLLHCPSSGPWSRAHCSLGELDHSKFWHASPE